MLALLECVHSFDRRVAHAKRTVQQHKKKGRQWLLHDRLSWRGLESRLFLLACFLWQAFFLWVVGCSEGIEDEDPALCIEASFAEQEILAGVACYARLRKDTPSEMPSYNDGILTGDPPSGLSSDHLQGFWG